MFGDEERQEPPTEGRKERARRAGLGPRSPRLTAALVLAAGGITACSVVPACTAELKERLGSALRPEGVALSHELWVAFVRVCVLSAPVLAACWAAAMIVDRLQGGDQIPVVRRASGDDLPLPDPRSLRVGGMGRALQWGVLACASAYWVLRTARRALAEPPSLDGLGPGWFWPQAEIRAALFLAVPAWVLIGALDHLLRRAALGRALRMTRRELEQEQRSRFGEPKARAQRRQMHRVLSGAGPSRRAPRLGSSSAGADTLRRAAEVPTSGPSLGPTDGQNPSGGAPRGGFSEPPAPQFPEARR